MNRTVRRVLERSRRNCLAPQVPIENVFDFGRGFLFFSLIFVFVSAGVCIWRTWRNEVCLVLHLRLAKVDTPIARISCLCRQVGPQWSQRVFDRIYITFVAALRTVRRCHRHARQSAQKRQSDYMDSLLGQNFIDRHRSNRGDLVATLQAHIARMADAFWRSLWTRRCLYADHIICINHKYSKVNACTMCQDYVLDVRSGVHIGHVVDGIEIDHRRWRIEQVRPNRRYESRARTQQVNHASIYIYCAIRRLTDWCYKL